MSLWVSLMATREVEIFDANITHNLGGMARHCGVYTAVWHPEDLGIKKAEQLIPILYVGLEILKNGKERFKKFDSENGWGTYEQFVSWLQKYLDACIENPDAQVIAKR